MRVNACDPPDEAVRALRARFTFEVQPALALLAPDGDVAHVQYARLYPAYHFNGVEMSSWTERLWTSRDILAMVERVAGAEAAERRRLTALAARSGPEAAIERARILWRRGRPGQALAVLDATLAAASSPAAGEFQAQLLAERGKRQQARRALQALLAAHPSHPRAPFWQLKAAAAVAQETDRPRGEDGTPGDPELAKALRTLRALASGAAPLAVRIGSHLALARFRCGCAGMPGQREHLDWLAERLASDGPRGTSWGPELLMELADLAMQAGPAYERKSATYTRAVVRCYPDSVQAQQIKHGLLDGCVRATASR